MAKITYDDKVIGSKWRAVDANEVKTSVNDLYDQVDNEAKSSLTGFRYQINSIAESDNKYTGWPYGCLFYDASVDKAVQVYSAKNSHVGTTGIVYIRKIDYKNSLDWSARVAIADRTAESLVATCHAAGMAANGDYLCIVRFTNSSGVINSTYLYRSIDQGSTWNGSQWVDSGASPLNPAESGSMFITQSGALLTYFRLPSGANYVYRSTDNGTTWDGHSVANSLGGTPLEGAFAQIPSGAIVAVVRATAISPPYITKASALYTVSYDDGVTWSSLATTNIEDMTNSPAGMLYHSDTNTIEIIYGSRYAQTDGYASLWQSETTPENLVLGLFNAPTRIAIGVSSSSFGYPAICKTADGHIITGYYNGVDPKTSINYMVGRRNGAPQVVSLESYNLLRNPATYESHADFSTPYNTITNRPVIGLKNVSYVNFSQSLANSNGLTIGGTDAVASTSGSAENGSIRLTGTSAIGTALDAGVSITNNYSWIQSRNGGDYAVNRELRINPNGGTVRLGSSANTSSSQLILVDSGSTAANATASIQLRSFAPSAANTTILTAVENVTGGGGGQGIYYIRHINYNGAGGVFNILQVDMNGSSSITSLNSVTSLLFKTNNVTVGRFNLAGSFFLDIAPASANATTDQHLYRASTGEIKQLTHLICQTKASDPVAADIPAGQFNVYKNTTSGAIKLWTNDGGTMKSVALV